MLRWTVSVARQLLGSLSKKEKKIKKTVKNEREAKVKQTLHFVALCSTFNYKLFFNFSFAISHFIFFFVLQYFLVELGALRLLLLLPISLWVGWMSRQFGVV